MGTYIVKVTRKDTSLQLADQTTQISIEVYCTEAGNPICVPLYDCSVREWVTFTPSITLTDILELEDTASFRVPVTLVDVAEPEPGCRCAITTAVV